MRRPLVLLAVLAVLVAGAVALWRSAGRGDAGGPRRQWFYDLRSRELYPVAMGVSPPAPAPGEGADGRNGVRAVVVRTGSGPAIAYLLSAGRSADEVLVRVPDGGSWVPERSPQGEAVLARARELSDGGPVVQDFPPDG